MTASGPLGGVIVLDFCHFLAGPYATMVLADLGADVIKVEDPAHPDEARSAGPHFLDGQSLYFLSLNWGKRSISLGLATPEGRQAVLKLAARADVVVDNYRPGVMHKLGLDHESLSAVNPSIITCSLTGFGETGPYAGRPGYDYTIQAIAGVMSLTGEPNGPPGKAGISYVDHSGGLAAALAVSAALVERGRTGRGRHVDLSLLDVQVSMLSYLAAWQLNTGAEGERTANASHPSLVPAQNFRTADGYVSVFVGNDAMWKRLVAAIGDPRLGAENYATNRGRADHHGELLALLSRLFASRRSAEWTEALIRHQVPCAPVNSLSEALRDEQVVARGLVETASHPDYGSYRHVAGPVSLAGGAGAQGAPLIGEHTNEVLRALGLETDPADPPEQ
jgi:crotonobetainyl-CoA:carnitine CoA-transferase CaiB-like acyl-CoA transferase